MLDSFSNKIRKNGAFNMKQTHRKFKYDKIKPDRNSTSFPDY